MPQLFVLHRDLTVTILLANIVDELLLVDREHQTTPVIEHIEAMFNHGSITHGPGFLRYFGLNIRQDSDMSGSIDGDEKIDSIDVMPISRCCRRNHH